MLSIANIGSHQAASYYKQDGYYARSGDEDSAWQGKLKKEFNLPDSVIKKHFDHFVLQRQERAGYDLCFSAPKSVSVAICLDEATRQDMVQAHQLAVTATLVKIEAREIGARVTAGGETEHIKTGNMLCGKFTHYVSRNSDPQLHTHAVILNQTVYNGKLYAVDNVDLYKNKMLYGQLYRNALAAELLQRGYDITVTDAEKGFFELKDMNEALLKQFSSRRAQILAQLKEWDAGNTPENAAQAALTTRRAKEHKDLDLLITSWKQTADELGGITLDAQQTPILRPEEEKRECYRQGRNKLARKEFAFTEKILRRRVLAAGVGCGLSETEYSRLLQVDQEVVNLGAPSRAPNGSAYYTTRQNLKTEREIFQEVAAARGTMPGMPAARAASLLSAREDPKAPLSAEQRQAVLAIAQTNDRYLAVQGLAGTGKTYMLNYARQVLEAEGYTVRGACFTGKAADGLEADARIPSITLHRHLNALEKETGRHVPRENMQDKTSWNFDGLAKGEGREIWVVDEASMVDNTVMRSLLEAAKRKEAKVVFVGDDRQLPPVGAGNAYGTMVQTGQIAKVGLTEIRRQKDAGLLQSVKEAVAGDIQKSLKLLDNNIHEIRKPKARLNAIVKEYLALAPAERQETVILTAANKDRRAINRQIREELKKQNALADGREFTLTDRSGRKTTQEFAAGDKVIFLKNDNQLQVRNGQTGIVESCAGHRLTIRSGDRTIVVDTAKYNRLDHGYVVTSHKAQGITVDRAIIHLDSSQAQLNTRNAFYVDISRARHAVKIFTDDKGKIKKQVKDFAKKITSRDFPAPQEQPEKNFYQAVRTGAEKIFTQLRREQGKARER
jgi:conjugative relaxase-like TrwC/TraI family protein